MYTILKNSKSFDYPKFFYYNIDLIINWINFDNVLNPSNNNKKKDLKKKIIIIKRI